MRTAGSISSGGNNLPPKGKYNFVVIGLEKDVSKGEKKTPFIEVQMSTGEDEFSDQLYVTEKTLSRLYMFAKRICGMEDTFELPDTDKEAAIEIAKFIMRNAIGKSGVVTIDESEEVFIPTSGPNMGRSISKMRRRVAFNGYSKATSIPPVGPTVSATNNWEDEPLPF